MAQVINSTDYLTFILTQYGLNRVGEALANPNEDLNISKIKVGDANFTYYEPTETQTELVHLIPDGEFYIVEKELLEDNLTVSFHAIFPETFENAEIREVGIYETIDGVDYLFAVSTQQPLLKPYVDLNYLISVDYYAFLKAQNLAEVYDQIVLNPDNQLVSVEDLENLMSTILFTEDNLMDQIHDNTKILGLNRVQQLQEKMDKDKSDFGYVASYNNYVTLLDYLDSSSDVLGYWLFNYPRRISPSASIIDIGPNGYNFSTNTVSNSYPRVFNGIMPMLSFDTGYFYLNDLVKFDKDKFDISGSLSVTEDGIASNFSATNSMTYTFKPITPTQSITLRAKGTYSSTPNTANGSQVLTKIVGTNSSPSIEYYPKQNHLSAVRFHNNDSFLNQSAIIDITLNDGDIVETEVIATSTYVTINAKINGVAYTNTWSGNGLFCGTISEWQATYVGNWYWTGSIDTAASQVMVDNKTVFSGIASSVLDFYNSATDEDISFSMLFAVEPHDWTITRTLLARSNYSSGAGGTHVFEVNELPNKSLEVKFFTDNDNYITYTSEANVIPDKAHSIIISYDATVLLNKLTVYVGAKEIEMTATDIGTFTTMWRGTALPLTSFVTSANGTNAQLIDSNVGVVSIIKKALTKEEMRSISLTLEATMGNNPCLQTY